MANTPRRPAPPARSAAPPARNAAPARPAAPARAPARPAAPQNGFVYRPRPPELTRQQAQRRSGGFEGIFKPNFDTYRPALGTNIVRAMPATWGPKDGCWSEKHAMAEHWGYRVRLHRNIGAQKGSYLCPVMFGKPCCICDYANDCQRRGEDQAAKDYGFKEGVVWWIIDRNSNEDKGERPRLFQMSGRQDNEIVNLTWDERRGHNFHPDDPDNGRDLTFLREGQGLLTRYMAFRFDVEPSPLHPDRRKQQALMDFIIKNPIPQTLLVRDSDYLDKVLFGTAEEADPLDADTDEASDTRWNTDPRDARSNEAEEAASGEPEMEFDYETGFWFYPSTSEWVPEDQQPDPPEDYQGAADPGPGPEDGEAQEARQDAEAQEEAEEVPIDQPEPEPVRRPIGARRGANGGEAQQAREPQRRAGPQRPEPARRGRAPAGPAYNR